MITKLCRGLPIHRFYPEKKNGVPTGYITAVYKHTVLLQHLPRTLDKGRPYEQLPEEVFRRILTIRNEC